MSAPTVVFDTNILFSGLGWRGRPFHCLQLARKGKVVLLTCREILTELEEKLRLKRNMPDPDAARAIAEILSFSRLVTITNTLRVLSTDPDDDKVLECAVVSGATHIVTGDRRHLLPLGSYRGVSIVTAADFLLWYLLHDEMFIFLPIPPTAPWLLVSLWCQTLQ